MSLLVKIKNLKVKNMTEKLKIILLLFAVCLIGSGVFYFSNIWKGDETKTQTAPIAQNLKLLNSHSNPEVGDEWIVSFETMGPADLTITPTDQESIDDLDFVSLRCEGKEKTEEGPLQILAGDVIFYPNWQCEGRGEVIHLVNIARKHTLEFQFSNNIAFAYNNPDSFTDTFETEDYIYSKENITVSGGQVYLSTCGDNGDACSADGECCSDNCENSVCCAFDETCCSSDGHCPTDSCPTTCQERDHYCDSATDHYCKYTDSNCSATYHCSSGSCGSGQCGGTCTKCLGGICDNQDNDEDLFNQCPGGFGTCAATNCSGSGSSCGYLTGQQGCATCTYCTGASYSCTNASQCENCYGCSGACNWCYNGNCKSCNYTYEGEFENMRSAGSVTRCKPTNDGDYLYSFLGSRACNDNTNTDMAFFSGVTLYMFRCICQ